MHNKSTNSDVSYKMSKKTYIFICSLISSIPIIFVITMERKESEPTTHHTAV